MSDIIRKTISMTPQSLDDEKFIKEALRVRHRSTLIQRLFFEKRTELMAAKLATKQKHK